ncbi:MAG: SH3 domain-containing protein [Clostridia bacterium]|nr:SH3 domain-containing protein [Clostridia bacterium]
MAKRKRRRRVRMTNLGKAFVALVIFVVVGVVALVNLANTKAPNVVVENSVTGSGDPLKLFENKASADATPVPTAVPTPAPSPTPTIRMIVTPVPDNAAFATPTPSPASVSRMPTPEEQKNAVETVLVKSGVNLRAGPNPGDKVLTTGLKKKTKIKVYAREDDFYFIQVLNSGLYGYVAVQFVDVPGFTPAPIKTQIPQGAVGGEVASGSLKLRSGPGTDYTELHEYARGTLLYVYFNTNDWYYVEICRNGQRGYMKAENVTVRNAPPAGTPVP